MKITFLTPWQQALGFKTPIILDNGSGFCKCGLADRDAPTSVFPAYIGRPKYTRTLSDAKQYGGTECYVGAQAQSMRGVLKLNYPLEHGVVTDWDDMEKVKPRSLSCLRHVRM